MKPQYTTTTKSYYYITFPPVFKMEFDSFEKAQHKYNHSYGFETKLEIHKVVQQADGVDQIFQVNPHNGEYLRIVQ